MTDATDLKIEELYEIDADRWNTLIDYVSNTHWKQNDLLIDNDVKSSALHLRNDNHGGSYITNRNNFVENGKTENTGLFISAANDITIQTGDWDEQTLAKEGEGWRKNVGLDRLYISKEGLVKIGTAQHPSTLHITGNLEIKENIMAKSRGRLNIYPNTDATNSRSFIEMWGDHPDREGELTFGGSFIRFFVGSTDKSFGHLGLVIKEDGRVGIGTFDPQQELSIVRHDEGNADVRLQNSSNQPLDVFSGTRHAGIWSYGARPLEFATNGKMRLKISANGNVGIGTNNPEAKLDVEGNIRLGNKPEGGNKLLLTNHTDSHYIAAQNWWTEFVSHPNEGWRFKAEANAPALLTIEAGSGNVGIGVEVPIVKLEIEGKVKATDLELTNKLIEVRSFRNDIQHYGELNTQYKVEEWNAVLTNKEVRYRYPHHNQPERSPDANFLAKFRLEGQDRFNHQIENWTITWRELSHDEANRWNQYEIIVEIIFYKKSISIFHPLDD